MDPSLARRFMVDSQLRPQAVTDGAVLAAMASVAREEFVPEAARAFAYFDRSIPLGNGGAMMPPAAIGRLLSAIAPRAGERALVVGDGGGYSAALLEAIGLEVTAIDGAEPPAGAKYDVVLIDGAIEAVPEALVACLVEGGRLATALLDRGVSRLVAGRVAGASLGLRSLADADVAPLPNFQRPRAFTF